MKIPMAPKMQAPMPKTVGKTKPGINSGKLAKLKARVASRKSKGRMPVGID